MMFVMLTHDNRSILSSFSELLSFLTYSAVAEEVPLMCVCVQVRHGKVWQGYLTSSL